MHNEQKPADTSTPVSPTPCAARWSGNASMSCLSFADIEFATGSLVLGALVMLAWAKTQTVKTEDGEWDSITRSYTPSNLWFYAVPALVVVAAVGASVITMQMMEFVNEETKYNPVHEQTMKDAAHAPRTATQGSLMEYEPGYGQARRSSGHFVMKMCTQRALFPMVTLVATAAWGSIRVARQRKIDEVAIPAALLCQMALRGALLGLIFSAITIYGLFLTKLPNNVNVLPLVVAFVACASEICKLFAVTLSTRRLVKGAEKPDLIWGALDCLLEAPRGLMLCAFSVGWGFITVENTLFAMMAATTPPSFDVISTPRLRPDGTVMAYDVDQTEITDKAILVVGYVTIAARVFFNIHPWLSGIVSGCLAKTTINKQREWWFGEDAQEMVNGCLPLACAHAFHDFLLTSLWTPAAVLCRVLFWYFSHRGYAALWDDFEELDAEEARDLENEKMAYDEAKNEQDYRYMTEPHDHSGPHHGKHGKHHGHGNHHGHGDDSEDEEMIVRRIKMDKMQRERAEASDEDDDIEEESRGFFKSFWDYRQVRGQPRCKADDNTPAPSWHWEK